MTRDGERGQAMFYGSYELQENNTRESLSRVYIVSASSSSSFGIFQERGIFASSPSCPSAPSLAREYVVSEISASIAIFYSIFFSVPFFPDAHFQETRKNESRSYRNYLSRPFVCKESQLTIVERKLKRRENQWNEKFNLVLHLNRAAFSRHSKTWIFHAFKHLHSFFFMDKKILLFLRRRCTDDLTNPWDDLNYVFF